MKIYIYFISALFLMNGLSFAQSKFDVNAKRFMKDYSVHQTNATFKNTEQLPQSLIEEYDLIPYKNSYYIGALALIYENNYNADVLKNKGIHISGKISNILSLRVPVNKLAELVHVSFIRYIEVGNGVSPELQYSKTDTRTDSVHAGFGGLKIPYKGEGVIIGIIDWGFDYTHPVFYDSGLTNLRLSRAWDQNKLSGPAPQGFNFGTEYVGQNELLAAQEDTLYVFGPGSHGTHVGGIAGGAGAGTDAVGIAPESELIFISLRRDAPSLIDAFNYIKTYAESVSKPFVINMSFGSHRGPHDGTDLKNLGIDALAGSGSIFVGSAGNNGNNDFHLQRDFNVISDTLYTVVDFMYGVNPEYFGQTLSMWGSENSDFSVSLKFVDGNNNLVLQTPFYLSTLEPSINDTLFTSNNDTIILRLEAVSSSPLNNKPNIQIEFAKPTNLKAVLVISSSNSNVHIWNNARLARRYTNWGATLNSNYPNAQRGNPDYGLGEPAGCGKSVITVAAHRAELIIPGGQIVYGQLANFSSRGPTVDGRTKPDISGPGQVVKSAVNSFDPEPGSIIDSVSFNGKTYGFANYSGTSMSGPAVAGIVALMLQAYPDLTAQQAKDIIKQTARLDNRTGNIDENGHLNWGWGKINALAAVLVAESLNPKLSQQTIVNETNTRIFPNPTREILRVEANYLIVNYQIYDLNGRIVREVNSTNDISGMLEFNVSDLPKGMYLLRLKGLEKSEIQQFLVH